MALPILTLLLALAPAAAEEAYRTEIQKLRDEQEAKLRAEDGWLTVVGLFWLKRGPNRFGADPSNEIVLPSGSGPARAGVFDFDGARATVRAEPGVPITVNGRAVSSLLLRADTPDSPDRVVLGDLSLQVLRRGARYGIRLRDKNSRQRREFTGRRWFPVQPAYRVIARFVLYQLPKILAIPNVLGESDEQPSPGYAVFTLGGKEHRLEPVSYEPGELFFIFKDRTAGRETYPAGRFLYTGLPRDGRLVLDFNQAVSPPCAFTDFATCPLPPRQNHLAVQIPAGERKHH